MVEVIHAGRNATENDSIIVGDNIDEIVQYCLPKIVPKSRTFYERDLRSDLTEGYRSLIDHHAGMGTFYAVFYIPPTSGVTLVKNVVD